MPVLKILGILGFLVALPHSSFAGAENGVGRGGGDMYVAEFRDIARSVLANIEKWRRDGTLQLADDQVANLNATAEIALVLSQDHVYLDDAEEQEVDAVNMPDAKPPTIIIGRAHWDLLKDRALDKETLVLHELLCVSKIHDRTFSDSYGLKAKTLREWAEFKTRVSDRLEQFFELNMDLFTIDFTQLSTFVETAKRTPEYRNCMNSPGSSKKAKKLQEQFCLPLVQLLLESQNDFLKNNMQKHYNVVWAKEQELLTSFNTMLLTQKPEWTNWAIQLTNAYIAVYEKQRISIQDQIGSDQVEALLESSCPSKNDFSFTIQCAFNAVENGFPAHFGQVSVPAKAALSEAYATFKQGFSTQANPL